MAIFEEKRICIKFCFKLKKSATETYELIKEAFGDAALSRSRTFEWFSRFQKGREKLKIKELIKSNRRISIKDLSLETGLSVGLCHQIVTKDLDMIWTSSKFVPRILTEEQKEVRMDVCKNMVEMTRTDPEWMQKIITGDETWVYQYDPETKRQSSQWIERGEPKPKKARFAKFKEAVRLKRPERWQNNDWILHVDNARPHTAHVVLQFLAKHSTIQISHPPYSPELAPNYFFLYAKFKMKLKGRKFDNVDMIQAESKATLRNLSKSDLSPASTIGKKDGTAPTGGRISSENGNQKILKENSENRVYANPPAGVKDVNLAAARDVTLNLPAGTSSNGAARVLGSWADCIEDLSPGAEDDFTVVKTKKRRRESSNSPTAAAPSSNNGGARSSRRLHSSARSVPRAQEIPTTRTHITEARARQASSSEEHCVNLEHGPELQPFHYLRALDRLLGGTAGIIQISKVNGHQLLGLANRGLAERLINNGLEVEGTLLRAFPFRKRAERITVSNLPFFVEDSAIINALRPFGRITSIAPKMMKAGPYTYTDGRREAFIVLHEGMTTERLPTRLDITIKGEAWPAYLSTGIKCSRCHAQGHRRANCPLLAGLANNTRTAPPTTPAGVPPPTTPAPPQRSAAQPPAPTPSNPAMEVCSAPPVARAALHSSAPRPSPPAAPAFPMEETPPAPPPVTPAPSLQTPGSREPAAPTPDVEMSIVEETLASFTSSAKNATRVDLDAFIEGHPSVSFAKTDALGLGREEVLDLLSSRTKAQRKGPLLSPPQCDALVGLIGQILDLRPGAASNLYKVLGQVKAELRTTPAVPPTPTLPAPWPSKPTPPALHGEKTSPDIATPPPPLSTEFIDACYDQANDIIYELSDERYSEPLSDIGVTEGDIVEAIIFPDDREPLLRRLSTQKRTTLAGIVSAASERARSSDPFVRPAGEEPGRPSVLSPNGGKKSKKNDSHREIYNENSISREYINPPADGGNANLAAARVDVISGVAATSSSNGAVLAIRNWADCDEVVNPGTDDDFTVVKTKKRRRESSNSPTAATPSSNSGGARSGRRVQSSARSVPRAQEIPTTRAHIAEARARQTSSAEEHCVYLEHGPELQPFHYLRALDRLLGGTAGVVQVSKVNGHQLLGLANRGLAERLINNGLEVEGTLLRAFPFRKRAERITVGNLPFFVEDSAIKALGPYGRITSITPKMMKAGPYTYTDGRREAFIVLHEGVTTERLPTRLNITIKGEAWPAYLSSGIKCSRCHGQGHRRANCPLLAGRTTAPGPATLTSPTSVPPASAPRLPQQPSAQPPPLASPSPTMEVSDVPPTSRAALHPPAALRQSPPAPSALPAEDAPPAPPPVTPAPSLRTPGSREPAAPTPDVEMSIVEETSESSTSSAKNATRIDLDAFIERHPSVSFAGTDALGLGREEVLDLLSSRTKAQRNGPLLSPPQCDALAVLIRQILDLRPGAATNLYKVLGQVKAELRTTEERWFALQAGDSWPCGLAFDGDVEAGGEPLGGHSFVEDDERLTAAVGGPRALMAESSTKKGRLPSVSFAGTDALGLGREEVLDLLFSRTKAQRNGPLLSPPQCDALAVLIRQILDLRPGAATNLYKVLGQVKAELRTTPAAVPPTPPLPAPRPAEPMLPTTHREELTHPLMTPPSPAPTDMEEDDPMTEKERGTPPPPAPRPAEPTSPALHMSTHVYLGQVKAELRTTPAVPPTPPLPAPRPSGPTPPTSHSEELMPAVMTPPPPALTEMEEDNPITEKERCVPPPPWLAEPTPPAPHREEVTPAMATPPPPLPLLLQVELESKCERHTRDLFEELDFQRALRPLMRKGLDLQGLSTAIMWPEINKIVFHCHYLQAVEELVGGAGNVLQVMKIDGHMLVGLSTKALAERLIKDGLDIGHTHLRAFPFKKRAERITIGNLPFFVDDAAVIEALKPYGDVTSIVPIRLRAGRYTFTDGRHEAFILLKEGIALEKIPTRVVIRNKGNVLSAFISYGVKCSRCGRQGHRRANCPINPGRASNNGQPQPAPLPPGASSTVSRQQSRPTPAAPALPMEETPSAPPPVTPAPPLQAPEGPVGPRPAGSQHPEPPPAWPDLVAPLGPLPAQKTLGPAAPTPDVEMSIVEETFASSTPSAKKATRVDLDAFIEGHPSVSFAETDALGLGREEVLDLLSSRTKAQRKGPLLVSNTPTACTSACRANTARTHGKMTTPAMATSPSPLFQVEEDLTSKRWDEAADIIYKLCNERYSGPLTDLGITEGDITDAVIYPEDREPLLRTCSTQKKNLITEIISAAIERARDSDPFVREGLYALRRMLLP
ncbi:hypothetical protein LAZ67_3001980 [Cordylochernes scorpioides]|uniref:CCHC-type domain-containing protein n=1 Tax=Cordylochernes scorpioides TaxID=51811 RepID=A0ABY6KAQ7_9ARAC|nr:hypothetical protein LAZ67_3001980 [Cordylochernes scorpioides]